MKRFKWFPFNILVHKILKEDRGDLHDHFWSYITIILKGGYWETTDKGTYWRGPGYIGFRKNTDKHSLKLKDNKPAWTIMLVGLHHSSKVIKRYQRTNLEYTNPDFRSHKSCFDMLKISF